jgi:hypothetical protein
MEFYDSFEGLIREKAHKKPTTEAKHNGSGVDEMPFSSDKGLMWAPVHLTFLTRGMINWRRWAFIRFWPDRADIILEDGIPSLIAKFFYLFQDPCGRKMIFNDEVIDLGLIRIEFAWTAGIGRSIRDGMCDSFQFPSNSIATNAYLSGCPSYVAGFLKNFFDPGSLFLG